MFEGKIEILKGCGFDGVRFEKGETYNVKGLKRKYETYEFFRYPLHERWVMSQKALRQAYKEGRVKVI